MAVTEQNSVLKPAPLSPRMDNGILKWFDGDTFTIQMVLSLVGNGYDEEGNPVKDAPIALDPTDQVVVTFYDCHKKLVHVFVSTNIPVFKKVILLLIWYLTKMFRINSLGDVIHIA